MTLREVFRNWRDKLLRIPKIRAGRCEFMVFAVAVHDIHFSVASNRDLRERVPPKVI